MQLKCKGKDEQGAKCEEQKEGQRSERQEWDWASRLSGAYGSNFRRAAEFLFRGYAAVKTAVEIN